MIQITSLGLSVFDGVLDQVGDKCGMRALDLELSADVDKLRSLNSACLVKDSSYCLLNLIVLIIEMNDDALDCVVV